MMLTLEKLMGNCHLQVYKKPAIENQGVNWEINIAKSAMFRTRNNWLELKQCFGY